jgi:hypothetical protein
MSDSPSSPDLTHQIAQPINEELKPAEEIPEWLRPTKWRILWLIGVLGFIWWTASIYHGHERLLYFSPQSLGVEKQTRIVLLGTSIPIFTSDREPDFSLPLLSDFLIDEGIWTPNTEPPKWYLIYHQYHPRKESWIFREFMRNQSTWAGWTLSGGGAWKVYRVFPEKLWDEILKDLRATKDPLDESIGDKLRTKREAFPEDEISGYQEASMSADYYDRVKPIREQTKPASDG